MNAAASHHASTSRLVAAAAAHHTRKSHSHYLLRLPLRSAFLVYRHRHQYPIWCKISVFCFPKKTKNILQLFSHLILRWIPVSLPGMPVTAAVFFINILASCLKKHLTLVLRELFPENFKSKICVRITSKNKLLIPKHCTKL